MVAHTVCDRVAAYANGEGLQPQLRRCSRTEYATIGAERHGGGCDGGLKRLLVGEGICYMHKGSGMTVMMAVWLRERK
ncbi:stAR-related lipid transfer protein 13 isoform X3 [Sesbania bispinosa]|nr:stAR-related lipid transfer protein 13 isoform X3 [Sesbania bispinosa]